jgi:hypothetical protein
LQVSCPEFKPQSHQKKKIKLKKNQPYSPYMHKYGTLKSVEAILRKGEGWRGGSSGRAPA